MSGSAEPAPERAQPLADVRILAVEQYGAGPFGTLHLADLGADVIRVESFDGDVGRLVPPYAEDGDSLFYETFNRNKRGIVLDLSSDQGRQVLLDLARQCDVVYSNLRGDVVARLGLTYADLEQVNPKIVCCSLSGYGMSGPRQAEPAFDYMVQGLTGWMSLTGDPAGPPTKSGLSLVDFSAGLAAACAVLAGVHAARRDGHGLDCDVSLFDTAMSMLTYVATWQLTRGFESGRQARSAHPTMVPFQAFPTADGWIVAGGSKEKFFTQFAAAIGRADLAADPRFADFATRLRHRAELIAELDATLITGPSAEWLKRLTEAGVPCAPVNSVEQALEDPHTAARGLIVTTDHPRFGEVRSIASPVRAGSPRTRHTRGPRPGEHTREVLETLCGYSPERVDGLLAAGVIAAQGQPEP